MDFTCATFPFLIDSFIKFQGPHSMLLKAMERASLEDGWVLGPNDELLFWVPPALRAGLLRPSNIFIMGDVVTTTLDFSSFVYGESWADCRG
jgi:hypothetical protein